MTTPQPQTNAASASMLAPVQAATSRLRKHRTNSATIAPRLVSLKDAAGSRRRGGGLVAVRAGGRVRAAAPVPIPALVSASASARVGVRV